MSRHNTIYVSYAALNIESGTIEDAASNFANFDGCAIYALAGSNTEITGGKVIGRQKGIVAAGGSKVKISGNAVISGGGSGLRAIYEPKVTLSGGTFTSTSGNGKMQRQATAVSAV